MASPAIESILQDRRIVYFNVNPKLHVTACHGAVRLLQRIFTGTVLQESLLQIVPELIGCEDVLQEVLGGTLPRFELAWINRDIPEEGTLYLNLVVLPQVDEFGQNSGLIVIIQEVSDIGQISQELAQRRNELRLLQQDLQAKNEALAAANAELENLSNLKTLFVSIAAHELRSPLTSISGYLELVLENLYGPLNQNQRHALEVAEHSVNRLKTITDNLLVATRIEAGQLEVFLQPANLTELVNRVAAEFEPQIAAKSQSLTIHSTSEQPMILCDSSLVNQIIANLMSNAIKYTPIGGEISMSVAESQGDAGYLQLAIADNGVGISAADLPQLFEQFSRTQTARLARTEGAGLGLYITRSLAEALCGRVWVESELNQGSTFFVTFPIAPAQQ